MQSLEEKIPKLVWKKDKEVNFFKMNTNTEKMQKKLEEFGFNVNEISEIITDIAHETYSSINEEIVKNPKGDLSSSMSDFYQIMKEALPKLDISKKIEDALENSPRIKAIEHKLDLLLSEKKNKIDIEYYEERKKDIQAALNIEFPDEDEEEDFETDDDQEYTLEDIKDNDEIWEIFQ